MSKFYLLALGALVGWIFLPFIFIILAVIGFITSGLLGYAIILVTKEKREDS